VRQLKESSNIFTGIYHGLKGGLGDILLGIGGLFTKPYQGAKREGAKGFVKGLGKGLVGVVTAPFSAVLRITSNITSGISNTGQLLAKGRVK